MSVATEFAPAVTIPQRARPGRLPEAPGRLVAPEQLASVTVLRAPGSIPGVAPVRLTRRGIAVLVLVVLGIGVGLVLLARASAPGAATAPPAPAAVTVESGDTLWSIASRVAPQRDPRAEVAAFQHRNHLTSVDLTPGQVLRVP